jgi:DNA-binding transcriptional MerR regulator
VANRSGRLGEQALRGRGVRITAGGAGSGRGGAPPRGRPAPLPVAPDPYRYGMSDLEEQTGLNARTIRYYISQGLLPPAHGRGPGATYDLGHLLRLRAILLLKANYLPLEEIKSRLNSLTDDDIAAMLEIETAPPEDRWRRVQLHPDVELHVRERGGKGRDRALDEAVDLIIGLARPVIDRLEDAP